MTVIPKDLKYSKTHEWARVESDRTVTIGITAYAQEALGDMVFVELPTVGNKVLAGKECGVVESVKSASDIYSPLSGEVIKVNEVVTATPALLNSEPYGEGWLYKITLGNEEELNKLMDAEQYNVYLEESEH
jgi:glycine cleavage system H protein